MSKCDLTQYMAFTNHEVQLDIHPPAKIQQAETQKQFEYSKSMTKGPEIKYVWEAHLTFHHSRVGLAKQGFPWDRRPIEKWLYKSVNLEIIIQPQNQNGLLASIKILNIWGPCLTTRQWIPTKTIPVGPTSFYGHQAKAGLKALIATGSVL